MSTVSCILHPLPILNISDYYTRCKLQNKSPSIGALFGNRTGKSITIHNAFEIGFTNDSFDLQKLETKVQLYITTFTDQELVGWYQIIPGSMTPNEQSYKLHQKISQIYDISILLMFDPNAKTASFTNELPLKAYEGIFQGPNQEFISVPIEIGVGEAERIGVDEIVSGQSTTDKHQPLISRLSAQINALEMFKEKLYLIRNYLKQVEDGDIGYNVEKIRSITGFINDLQYRAWSSDESINKEQDISVLVSTLITLAVTGDLYTADLNAKNTIKSNENRKLAREIGVGWHTIG